MSSILEWTAPSHKERLWLVTGADGRQEIVDEAGKQGRAGSAPAWGDTLGKVLATMVDQIEGRAHFWLQFGIEFSKSPTAPSKGDKVHLVTPGFQAFTAYVEQKGGGFGGDRFEIEMLAGPKFWSADVWSRGLVPVHLRDLLQPNACAIKGLKS